MTLADVLKACSDADGTVHDRPFVLVDEQGGWTNVNAKAVNGRVELREDKKPLFEHDAGMPAPHTDGLRLQARVREMLIERCKDCLPYAPMILPDVLAYLECEKSGNWSGWHKTTKEETHEQEA